MEVLGIGPIHLGKREDYMPVEFVLETKLTKTVFSLIFPRGK
jgi:hypothetical protein